MANPVDPAPVLTALEGFRRSKTMFAALELGVFERLNRGSAGAEDLSRELVRRLDHDRRAEVERQAVLEPRGLPREAHRLGQDRLAPL